MAIRRRPKIKFFLIVAVTVVVIAVVLILLFRTEPTAAVEWASTEYEAQFDMLIVRDEVVYEAKNYGMTDFIAEEGDYVEVGDPIVEVYEWGYNEETLSKLLDLQQTILTYEVEVSRAGVLDEDLDDINSRIDAKATEIQQAVFDNQLATLVSLKRDMQSLLEERMAHLKEVVVADNQLNEYYEEEQVLLEQIAEWCNEITANESGIVSFYFDGCEALMSKDNIGSFTKKVLEEVSEGKTIETAEEDQAYAPLYRVVNENEWYVVMLSDSEIPEMFLGDVFSIVFDDYLDTQYTGVVYDAAELEENDGFVYTILIQDNIGPLLGERRVSAKLYTVIEGMRVPKACVKATDEVDYVETEDGEVIPVFVIAEDGEYYFIQTYADQATLEIGQVLKK